MKSDHVQAISEVGRIYREIEDQTQVPSGMIYIVEPSTDLGTVSTIRMIRSF